MDMESNAGTSTRKITLPESEDHNIELSIITNFLDSANAPFSWREF